MCMTAWNTIKQTGCAEHLRDSGWCLHSGFDPQYGWACSDLACWSTNRCICPIRRKGEEDLWDSQTWGRYGEQLKTLYSLIWGQCSSYKGQCWVIKWYWKHSMPLYLLGTIKQGDLNFSVIKYGKAWSRRQFYHLLQDKSSTDKALQIALTKMLMWWHTVDWI